MQILLTPERPGVVVPACCIPVVPWKLRQEDSIVKLHLKNNNKQTNKKLKIHQETLGSFGEGPLD